MTRIFDRSDYDSRSLKACYRELGDRLSEEAAALRSELHERHYPGFGAIGGGEQRAIFERVRARKGETDQILRAIHWKLRHFQTTQELDTEALYDFCMLAQRAAQFLQFSSLALFAQPGDVRAKDPVLRDADWQELDKLGK